MTRRVNQFSPRWWRTERTQHSQDLDPVTKYPNGVGGGGSGKGLELWSSTKAYAKNDVVFFNSPDVKGIFVANENIPASGFLNIGVDGPTWSVVGDEFASIPNWYAMEWPANSVVVRAGAIRRAIGNTSATWVDSEWDNLTPAPSAVDTDLLFENHDAAKSYKKDQAVVVSGKLYRARTNIGALPFSLSDWEEISPTAASGLTEVQIFDFDTVDTYKANELCVLNDKLYRAINNTGPGTFVISDWKEVSAASAAAATTVGDFSTSKAYVTNELTIQNGRLYRATKDSAAGAFNLTNFAPADATGIVDAFDPAQSYNKGEIIRHQASFFMALNNVAAGPFVVNSGNWAYIGGGTVTTTDWNNSLFYPFGATVIKDKAVYRSKANQMAGAWVDNLWEPIASLHGRLPAFSGVETYYKDMVVTYNGFAWRCTVVTAAASTMPEGNPNWEKLFSLSLNPNILPYTTNAKYNSGDVVVAEGRLIRANKAIASAPAVFTPADWEALSQLSLAVWNGGKCSFVGDTFVDNGVLWRCKVTDRGSWSDSNFEEIGKIDQLKPYDASKKYRLNQLVTRNGQILRCESDVSSIGFDSDDWEFFGHLEGIQPFSVIRTYEKQDVVTFNNVVWETSGHRPAGAFNPTEWNRVAGTPRIADFIANFPYEPGDIIKIGNKLYINGEGVGRATILMTDWTQFGQLRGLWDITQVYLAEDIVINGNNIYRANGVIPANTAFVQGAGTAEWTRLSPSEPPSAPDFAPLQAYKKDSLVIRGGKLYRSKADFTALASWDDANWQALVAEAAASVPDFVLAKDYVLNQVVAQDGVLYRARSVISAAQADKLPAADPTKWQAVSLTYIHVPDHSATGTYSLNECVINPADNRMYRAKAVISTGRAFSLTDWTLIADRVPNLFTWDTVTAANNVYFASDIVFKDGQTFVAVADGPSAGTLTWTPANFKALTKATVFQGLSTDTTHTLPVGTLVVLPTGTLAEITVATTAAAIDDTKYKIISSNVLVAWNNTTVYPQGQLVGYRGGVYKAKQKTTAGSVPSTATADWDLILKDSGFFEDFSATATYDKDQVVIKDLILYRAKANVAAAAWDATKWDQLGQYYPVSRLWNATKASNRWNKGDIVYRYGDIYLATATADSAGEDTWPNAKLSMIGADLKFLGHLTDVTGRVIAVGQTYLNSKGALVQATAAGTIGSLTPSQLKVLVNGIIDPWSAGIYAEGIIVSKDGREWIATGLAASTDVPGDANVWQPRALYATIVKDWVANLALQALELVIKDGKLYRAKEASSLATWDDTKFTLVGGAGGIDNWNNSTDYKAGNVVRHLSSFYTASEDIPKASTAPGVNFKWIAGNKSTGIVALVSGETVAIGDYREYNNMGLRANTAHTVAATIDKAELAQWDIIYGAMGNANYTAKTYIAPGSVLDFSATANWTKSGSIALPASDDFAFWKDKGARFYLNGIPITSAASAFTVKGFTLAGNYIEVGDVISVEF